jgi:23S rRNA (guanine745-N1)-methyltransferase
VYTAGERLQKGDTMPLPLRKVKANPEIKAKNVKSNQAPLSQGPLRCPLCAKPLFIKGGSYVCRGGHCYDISAKGYVNFVLKRKAQKSYEAETFLHRQRFLQAGFYDHILDALLNALKEQGAKRVVDAGCGEGYFARRIGEDQGTEVYALDYSKDSIMLAATGSKQVCWMVADLARMPLQDGMADAVINVFAPANYKEFARVLKPGGILVKVIPGPDHLRELREAARDQLKTENYSVQPVADYFARHFQLSERKTVTKTYPIEGQDLETLLNMTPLLFAVDKALIDRSGIREITIQAEILVGTSQKKSTNKPQIAIKKEKTP